MRFVPNREVPPNNNVFKDFALDDSGDVPLRGGNSRYKGRNVVVSDSDSDDGWLNSRRNLSHHERLVNIEEARGDLISTRISKKPGASLRTLHSLDDDNDVNRSANRSFTLEDTPDRNLMEKHQDLKDKLKKRQLLKQGERFVRLNKRNNPRASVKSKRQVLESDNESSFGSVSDSDNSSTGESSESGESDRDGCPSSVRLSNRAIFNRNMTIDLVDDGAGEPSASLTARSHRNASRSSRNVSANVDSSDDDGWTFKEKGKGDVATRAQKILHQCKSVSSNLRCALLKWSGGSSYSRKKDLVTGTGAGAAGGVDEAEDDGCVNLTSIAPIEVMSIKENTANVETIDVSKEAIAQILTSKDIQVMCPGLELKEYQYVGVNWLKLLYQFNINGVLADDMGLGKTIQTIAFLGWLRSQTTRTMKRKTHFIVVPASTLNNWMNEMKRFAPSLTVVTYHGSQADRAEKRRYLRRNMHEVDIIFSTYTIFERDSGSDDRVFLSNQLFDYLILDEAHCIKNSGSSRYYNLNKLSAKHRLLLSGTPVQNDVGELLSLLSFLMPKLFGQTDCELLLESFGWSGSDKKHADHKSKASSLQIKQLRAMMAPFVLRRLKKDVLTQLVKKETHVVAVPMTEFQSKVYNDMILGYQERKQRLTKQAQEENNNKLFFSSSLSGISSSGVGEYACGDRTQRKAAVAALTAVSEQSAILASNNLSIGLNKRKSGGEPDYPVKKEKVVVDLVSPVKLEAEDVEETIQPESTVLREISASEAKHLFTALRKAANHPLLLRVRYQDDGVMDKIARVAHTRGYFGTQCDLVRVKEELESNFSDFDIHQLCSEYPQYLGDLMLSEDVLYDSPKMMKLREMVPPLLTEGHRILIFSQWTRLLDLLEVLLNDMDLAFLRLDGSTPVNERQRLIDIFNNSTVDSALASNPEAHPQYSVNIFLLSTKAGGLGINLTSADTVIMHDLDFNPENDRQAEDRVHRIGQTKPVTVYKLVTEETVDKDIFDMGERKQVLSKAVLGDSKSKTTSQNNVDDIGAIGRILQSALTRCKQPSATS